MKPLWIAALPIALPMVLMAAPAAAQDSESAGDVGQTEDNYAVNQLIIYDENDCPPSTGNVIVVCALEEEPFRIPKNLRTSDDPANESWSSRAQSFMVNGPYGQNSCSPTGSEGAAGCTAALIEAAYEERRTGSAVRFSQLIEEAREERLETIDDDAADEQARVEVIEREYLDRLEREREAALPDEVTDESGAAPAPAPIPAEPAVVDAVTDTAPPPPPPSSL